MNDLLDQFYEQAESSKFSNVMEKPTPKANNQNDEGDLLDNFYANNETTKQQQEGWGTWLLRSLYQIPSGIAKRATYPLDLLQLMGTAEATDPEEIERIRRASEAQGIPFDEEKYMQAVGQAAENFPSQGNIERMIEEKTGAPLTPQTKGQKLINLASTAGSFAPASATQRAAAAATAPAVTVGLEEAGVPENIAEFAGLTASGLAGAKTPAGTIGAETKPSGLPKRQFENVTEPKKVSEKKIGKIEAKVENDFRKISDEIIASSPIEKTAEEIKANPAFKMESAERFKDVERLAESLPETIESQVFKKAFVDKALKKKGTGFAPGEYEKDYRKFVIEAIKGTPEGKITPADLVTQYRKNNKELGGAYEPSKSRNYNEAKKDALLDYNRTIADIIEKEYPGSDFSKLFKETNEQWKSIKDVESVNKFVDDLFDKGLKYNKGREFFDKNTSFTFKRALGKEYPRFEQLMKDMLSSEKPFKMLKKAESAGFIDFARDASLFVLHPTIGKAKMAFDHGKRAIKFLMNSMLDKPSLAVKWQNAVQELKKGNFAKSQKVFEEVKAASEKPKEAVKPDEILKAENPKTEKKGETIEGKAEKVEKPKQENQEYVLNRIEELKEKQPPVESKRAEPEKIELEHKSDQVDDFRNSFMTQKKGNEMREVNDISLQINKLKEKRDVIKGNSQKSIKERLPYNKKINELELELHRNKQVDTPKKIDEKIQEAKKNDISKKGLKSQKEFILDRIEDALENPSKYGHKIELNVPGDGEFKIHNNKKALEQFKKDVEKKWPKESSKISKSEVKARVGNG